MNDLMADAGGTRRRSCGAPASMRCWPCSLALIALITAVFALQSTVSLRADEASGIIEPQLAGAMSRNRWATQRLLIPTVGARGAAARGRRRIGAGYGSIIGDPRQTRPAGLCRPGVLARRHGVGRHRRAAVRLAAAPGDPR